MKTGNFFVNFACRPFAHFALKWIVVWFTDLFYRRKQEGTEDGGFGVLNTKFVKGTQRSAGEAALTPGFECPRPNIKSPPQVEEIDSQDGDCSGCS